MVPFGVVRNVPLHILRKHVEQMGHGQSECARTMNPSWDYHR
jgi:hypothetical protein